MSNQQEKTPGLIEVCLYVCGFTAQWSYLESIYGPTNLCSSLFSPCFPFPEVYLRHLQAVCLYLLSACL